MKILANPEVWVLISFLIFFGLFGTRLLAAINGLLDGRAAAIRTELDEAQRLRTEAEAMLEDAKRARAEALAEAEQILRRSQEEAAHVAAAAAAEAEAAARRRERLALDRIGAAEKAALTEVREAAAEIATQAARVVIAEGLGEERQTAILEAAIADLPRALRAA